MAIGYVKKNEYILGFQRNLFHIAHSLLGSVYMPFGGHDIWPTFLPTSLIENS